jgi:hypothetical protein
LFFPCLAQAVYNVAVQAVVECQQKGITVIRDARHADVSPRRGGSTYGLNGFQFFGLGIKQVRAVRSCPPGCRLSWSPPHCAEDVLWSQAIEELPGAVVTGFFGLPGGTRQERRYRFCYCLPDEVSTCLPPSNPRTERQDSD